MDYRELSSWLHCKWWKEPFLFPQTPVVFWSSSLETTAPLWSDGALGHSTTRVTERKRHLSGIISLASLCFRSSENVLNSSPIKPALIPSHGSLSPAVCLVFFSCKLAKPQQSVFIAETGYNETPILAAPIFALLTTKTRSSNLLFLSHSISLLHKRKKVMESVKGFIRFLFAPPHSPLQVLGMKERSKYVNYFLFFSQLNQAQASHSGRCGFYCSVDVCTVNHNLALGSLFHLLAKYSLSMFKPLPSA